MLSSHVGWVAVACGVLGCGGTALDTGKPGSDLGEVGSRTASAGAVSVGGRNGEVSKPGPPAVDRAGGPNDPGNGSNAGGTDSYGSNTDGASGARYAGSGSAGTGGTTSEPYCPAGAPVPVRAWQPRPSVIGESVADSLAESRALLAGTWRGIAHTQFVPPYSVLFTFNADGGYSARCTEHSDALDDGLDCCRALYYGTDGDSSLKQWALTSAGPNRTVNGDLDIIYSYGDAGFGESGYQGRVVGLDFDATGDRARFSFEYGDIDWGSFDLERSGP
jgi:hypothetical protein